MPLIPSAPKAGASKTGVVKDVLWPEKYRPQVLADVALEPENRNVIQSFLDEGAIPHLLLVGPPGSGKTTVSRILNKSLDCVVLPLNASAERGIDTVRAKIGTFVTAVTNKRWNIVFLDEADAMTSDAQTALRNLIESYSEQARFILTANHGHRIIAPIQSRCQVLTFGQPPIKERYRILAKVLKSEQIESDPQTMLGYATRFADMRKMLNAAQRAYLGSSDKKLPPATIAGPATGADMFQFLIDKNWTKFRGLTTLGDFDTLQALRDIFWAVPDEHEKAGMIRELVGRGVHESGFTPDPIVLFLGVLSGVMERL